MQKSSEYPGKIIIVTAPGPEAKEALDNLKSVVGDNIQLDVLRHDNRSLQKYNPRTLQCRNLPYQTEDWELEDLLKEYGEIYKIHMVSDRETGRPIG